MKPYQERLLRQQRQRRQQRKSETPITPPHIEPYRPSLRKKIKIIRDVNRARKSIMQEPKKFLSRKFLVTLGIDILVLILIRFGLSEESAIELVKWITGTYIVIQGGVDAAGPVSTAVSNAIVQIRAKPIPDSQVGYPPALGD